MVKRQQQSLLLVALILAGLVGRTLSISKTPSAISLNLDLSSAVLMDLDEFQRFKSMREAKKLKLRLKGEAHERRRLEYM
jgi:hypothetical protein